MSYWWVMQYLLDKLKERPSLGGPYKALKFDKSKEKTPKSKVVHLATGDGELFSNPQEKSLLKENG